MRFIVADELNVIDRRGLNTPYQKTFDTLIASNLLRIGVRIPFCKVWKCDLNIGRLRRRRAYAQKYPNFAHIFKENIANCILVSGSASF